MGHRLPLCPGFELLYRWITTLAKGDIDSLHDDVVDFTPLVKGGFAQGLVDGFGQVQAGMHNVTPWPAASELRR